jgi:hypothetical protein
MLLAILAVLLVVALPSAGADELAIAANRSIGVLRINASQPIPKDLRGVRYLLLDAGRARRVAGLKKRYPGLRVLAYKNLSFLIDYSRSPNGNAGVPWGQAGERWFLHDKAGRRVHSAHFEHAWFADIGRLSYQRAWSRDVLRFLRRAPWDGVFMDDALADPGWQLGGRYERLARYPTGTLTARPSARCWPRSGPPSRGPDTSRSRTSAPGPTRSRSGPIGRPCCRARCTSTS